MEINSITGDILDAAMAIHRHFGPGMLESAYERLLTISLQKRGHKVECQKNVSFSFEGELIENAFRLDLLVDDVVVVELKASDKMNLVYAKQVKTYLSILRLPVGLLINFGMPTLKEGFVRVVNNYIE